MTPGNDAALSLRRLQVLLVVAALAFVAVPALRLFDALKTSQDAAAAYRRARSTQTVRAALREVSAAALTISRLPPAEARKALGLARIRVDDAWNGTLATGDPTAFAGASGVKAKVDRVIEDLRRKEGAGWSLADVDRLRVATTDLAAELDRGTLGLLSRLEEESSRRRDAQWRYLFLALAFSAGTAYLLVVPALRQVSAAVRDLQESQQVAQKVSERRAEVLDGLPLAVLSCSPDGRVQAWNGAAVALTGLQFSHPEAAYLPDLLGPGIEPLLDEVREGRTAWEREIAFVPLGGDRTVPGVVTLARLPNGDLIATVRDLSENVAQEANLARETARAESLLNSVFDAYVRLDPDGHVLEYRPAPDWTLVSRPSALLGRPLEKIVLPADVPAVERARRTAEVGRAERVEFTVYSGGEERRIEGSFVRQEDGTTVALLRDATLRTAALASLRRSEEALAASQSVARIGSWEFDLGTGAVDLSAGLMELLEIPPAAPHEAERILERMDAEDAAAFRARLEACEREGTAYAMEATLRLPSGRVMEAVLRGDVRRGRMLGIVRDATESKQLERELVAAREIAERSARMKTEFLANMSHEIRTPMNGIIGVVYLLLESGLDERQANYARTIQRSGDSLLHLINDVLDLSKIESGKMTLERAPFSLADVLAEVRDVARGGVRGPEVAVLVETAPGLPDRLEGDAARLKQVLSNLAGNAVKFTQRGAVVLSARPVAEEGRRVTFEIAVRDTGIGIPADRLAVIWEKFAQADGSTTRRYGGTGLGLAISRQLVELMGGSLEVSSVEGEGSVFTLRLTLPRAAPAGPALPPTAEPVLDREVSILVAEDNPVNQMVVRDLLRARGCRVEVAGDGARAVEAVLAGSYDLILMDVQMPVMDGYAATAELRRRGVQTPIVAMTANALEGDREKCLDAGMDDYLPKPVRPPDLVSAIVRWTSPSSHAPEAPMPAPLESDHVFDPGRLADMFGADDPMIGTILAEYLRSSEELVGGCLSGDPGRVKADAHALKGASRTIGADALGDLCERIERGTDGDRAEALGELPGLYSRTRAAVASAAGGAG